MKTTDELNGIRNEIDVINKKLAELNDDELQFVIGGLEVGGLTGRLNFGTIDNCYNGGIVTDTNNGTATGTNVGGVCGKNESDIVGKEANPFIGTYDGSNKTVDLNVRP